MQFKIAVPQLRLALKRALGIVKGGVKTMPILSMVHLEALSSRVKVTAFDLENGIVSEHDADVKKQGEALAPAQLVSEIAGSLPAAGEVSLELLANNFIELKCGAAHFKLPGLPVAEFPKLPKSALDDADVVKAGVLLEMFRRVNFALSNDETRYVLMSVMLERVEKSLRMATTDGHRLAVCSRELKFKAKSQLLVARAGIRNLVSLLGEDPEGEDKIGALENVLVWKRSHKKETPGATLIMRLIEGQFPAFDNVIPERVGLAKLKRVEFADALRRVMITGETGSKITLKLGATQLRLSSKNVDTGESRDDVAVEYGGKEVTAHFNGRYLLDALEAVDGDDVQLQLTADTAPGVILSPTDTAWQCIVMPMRG